MTLQKQEDLFTRYNASFHLLNDKKHQEYAKWEFALYFRPQMDKALQSPAEDFISLLKALYRMSGNYIDHSGFLPFSGLIFCAEKKPESVRKALLALFEHADKGISAASLRITKFMDRMDDLCDDLCPWDFRLRPSVAFATSLLFWYDPDHNYPWHPLAAELYALHCGFSKSLGSGRRICLNVYEELCDHLNWEVRESPQLTWFDRLRRVTFQDTDWFADQNRHLLTWDILYCALAYDLYPGSRTSLVFGRRETFQEQFVRAAESYTAYLDDSYGLSDMIKADRFLNETLIAGCTLIHPLGPCTLQEYSRENLRITVAFPDGSVKKFGAAKAFAQGTLKFSDPDLHESVCKAASRLEKRKELLVHHDKNRVNFEALTDFLLMTDTELNLAIPV